MTALCPRLEGQGEPPPGEGFQRPAPQEVRRELSQILEDPRFRPRRTFLQWLGEKLSGWDLGREVETGGKVVRIILWVALAWGVLAVLAIMGHAVWTAGSLLRRSPKSQRLRLAGGGVADAEAPGYEELRELMSGLVEQGQFRRAVRVMMKALLRWLDDAGAVSVHRSKTNADYLRGYSGPDAGRESLRRFCLAFEPIVYGDSPCGPRAYRRLAGLFERTQRHVRQDP